MLEAIQRMIEENENDPRKTLVLYFVTTGIMLTYNQLLVMSPKHYTIQNKRMGLVNIYVKFILHVVSIFLDVIISIGNFM